MSTQYQPGEIVDIAIKGVRVAEHNVDLLNVELLDGARHWLPLTTHVTVTRRAPAEWPPQTDDVWKGVSGNKYWVDGELMRAARRGPLTPEELLDLDGPLTLAYREGWAPSESAPEGDEPDERDFRERFSAGLFELAEHVEAHPDMPLPRWPGLSGALANADEVSRAAYALGVDEQREAVGNAVHWRAKRDFGPINVSFTHVEHAS